MMKAGNGVCGERVETSRGTVEMARFGAGRPVLVLHGTPGGADCGAAMSRFLVAAGFEAIAPSRPGYPGTPLAAGASIDEQADLYAAVLDALGLERVGVLAWSGGGPSAFRLAVRHPARVSALAVFAGVSGSYVSPHLDLGSRFALHTAPGNLMLRVLTERVPRLAIRGTLATEGKLTRRQLASQLDAALGEPEQRRFALAMSLIAADSRKRRAGIDNDRARFAAIDDLGLERVEAPTLLVHGDADTDVAPEHSDRSAGLIPGAELHTIPAGTHFGLYVHPEAAAAQARVVEALGSAS
jgi:pimeloyl-ACP methyl ester carboxylesterase